MGYVSLLAECFRLVGGFKHFLFSTLLGEMIQVDVRIFFRCVGGKPLSRLV